MPTKSITAASLWTLIMVAAKHRRRERVDRTPTGPPPALRPALRAFTYKGAMGLNPDDHAEGSGICRGSRFPLMALGPTSGGVINGDFPAPLLAFDEDDEVFDQRLAGQPRRRRRCGDRQFPREGLVVE
jgi:hypothetical protein